MKLSNFKNNHFLLFTINIKQNGSDHLPSTLHISWKKTQSFGAYVWFSICKQNIRQKHGFI